MPRQPLAIVCVIITVPGVAPAVTNGVDGLTVATAVLLLNGFVVGTFTMFTEAVPLGGADMQEKISRKSNEFLRVSRAVNEIKKMSNRLLGKMQPPEQTA